MNRAEQTAAITGPPTAQDNAVPGMQLKRHWGLRPGITFLNHGSFGACPTAVLALQQELRAQMEAEPVQFLWRRFEERLEPSRRELADFVGANPKDVVFVTNATSGVNSVVRSLALKPGDELLTTNLDYNACRNALAEGARAAGATLMVAQVPFPITTEEQIVRAVMEKVTSRTRLVMLDHITSSTAIILPVSRMIRELEQRGIDTLIDGAHAPGMVPLDVQVLNPAYYTGNLHKWVCAPKGAAFLWAREDKQSGLQPAVVSHGNNTPRPGYTSFQDRFDWTGTADPTAWFCVGPAIRFMGDLLPGGWDELRRRNSHLALHARAMLCERLGVEAPCPPAMLGAMSTIPLPDRFQTVPRTGKIDREQLRLYDEFKIEVPLVRLGPPERRFFRISCQVYNTLGDYERLATAIARL